MAWDWGIIDIYFLQMQNLNAIKITEEQKFPANFFRPTFAKELRCMYWSEKKLIGFLSKAERAASTKYLKACFKGHKLATLEQIKRIEQIFEIIDEKPFGRTCHEISALIHEGQQILKATEKNTLSRDMGLITLTQKIEHLEAKKYDSLINLGNELGSFKIIFLLEATLIEEQEAEEAFGAVLEDTLDDEKFKIKLPDNFDKEEEIEHLQAV